MMKKIFFMTVLSALFFSCNTGSQEAASDQDAATNALTVDQLYEQAEALIDSAVVISGEVDHVCKHGGGKMVVFNPETDKSIHVLAPENEKFVADKVMNQNVIVWGVLKEKRVDENYIADMEAKLQEDIAKGAGEESAEQATEEEEHHGEESAAPDNDEKHKKEIEARKKQIESLKSKLEKRISDEGKDYLSFYSVQCTKYTVVEDDDDDHGNMDKDDDDAGEHHEAEETEEHDHE